MERISLIDSNNRKVQVFLVRFFKFNNDKYLIYTLNEKDEKNYVKLYLVKVMEEFGRYLSYHISDDEEWRYTQSILKTVLKEIKYNQQDNFIDLDYSMISGMKIQKARIFKFDERLVEILTKNINGNNVEDNKYPEIPIPQIDVPENNVDVINYKKKYEEAEKEIDRLNEIMGELLAENIMYKSEYGELNSSLK